MDEPPEPADPRGGAAPGERSALQRAIAHMEPFVFVPSALLVVGFVALGSVFSDRTRQTFEAVHDWLIEYFGWLYMVGVTGLLLFAIWLPLSRFGSIKLGGDDSEPEFGNFSWFTMLFSAGMGTGLVFWGVAEPLTHHQDPPAMAPSDAEPALTALRYSFFHWGLHPWGVYAVFGLGLAYMHFRRGLPLAPRSLLHPLLGERIYGPAGHIVDTLATVGTLLGVATSLGLGAMQIAVGLQDLFGWSRGVAIQVVIIAVITGVATISVVSGIHRGIRFLSGANLSVAAALLVFVAAAGPTLYLIDVGVTTLGSYLSQLVSMSLHLETGADASWQADWTLFYWAWWVSWSPFVGVFTARISRGRTVRQYVLGVLLLPAAATFLWLSVFGGTAIDIQGREPAFAGPIVDEPALALHALLDHLPLAWLTPLVGTLMILIFFVTSSDSGSLVDDMVTSGGDPNPPRAQRVFWAVSEGAVAITLLLTGGLRALRAASLISGLPMLLFLCIASYGLLRALRAREA